MYEGKGRGENASREGREGEDEQVTTVNSLGEDALVQLSLHLLSDMDSEKLRLGQLEQKRS